ncbi:hypothetical protein EVAR_16905_1 [Eumeta japonica]|uniref:Uncharacterized protein n=1 Tax=Eumeta variegata TaxID=151549 RepID=A0A4C1TV95_EUMVA|nr:hypothetical protein EVAR_16905_1 [Eumeta japonica]
MSINLGVEIHIMNYKEFHGKTSVTDIAEMIKKLKWKWVEARLFIEPIDAGREHLSNGDRELDSCSVVRPPAISNQQRSAIPIGIADLTSATGHH